MSRRSNPNCEICNQLSFNDLEKTENRPTAFWECVQVTSCQLLSRVDPLLMKLVERWPRLEDSTRKAIEFG